MAEQHIINVTADGKVSAFPVQSEEEQESKLDEIIAMINDPDAPLAPIKRLIAAEIAKAGRMMLHYSNEINLLEGMKIKALEAQVKALRELGKELMESEVLSKKDFLNWDGPKLAFVLNEYRQGVQDVMKTIGIDDATAAQILRAWRDEMQTREITIRRNVEKMEFNKSS